MLGLRCCSAFSLVVASGGYSPVAVRGLHPERKLNSCSQAELLRSTRGLPASVIEPGPLHWQADSSPLSHQGNTFSSPFEDSSLPWAKEERERDLNCSSLSSFCFVKGKNSRVRAQVLNSTHLWRIPLSLSSAWWEVLCLCLQ